MTVENPGNDDFGTWRCSVGTRKWVDANLEDQPLMQALISLANTDSSKFIKMAFRAMLFISFGYLC